MQSVAADCYALVGVRIKRGNSSLGISATMRVRVATAPPSHGWSKRALCCAHLESQSWAFRSRHVQMMGPSSYSPSTWDFLALLLSSTNLAQSKAICSSWNSRECSPSNICVRSSLRWASCRTTGPCAALRNREQVELVAHLVNHRSLDFCTDECTSRPRHSRVTLSGCISAS